MTSFWPYLVVLAPALFCTALGFIVTVSPWVKNTLMPWYTTTLQSEAKVEYLRDLCSNLSFMGGAAGIAFGMSENSLATKVVAITFFAMAQWYAWDLVARLERLRAEKGLLQVSNPLGVQAVASNDEAVLD